MTCASLANKLAGSVVKLAISVTLVNGLCPSSVIVEDNNTVWSKYGMAMIRLSRYIATWLIIGYRIYSITDIIFNDTTPLLTYKATEQIKLSLVVYVS